MLPQAICCAVDCMHAAIGTRPRTRSGYITPHSRTCMPPIEPPITVCQAPMPRWSARRAWARTMSRIVMTGKREPYGLPSTGEADAGPVDPWQPPSTLAHTTNQRLVSIGLPGPDEAVPPSRRRMPAPGRTGGVAVAGPGVAQQHGVGRVGGELAPGLVGHGDVAQGLPAVEGEAAVDGEREEAAVPGVVAGTATPRTPASPRLLTSAPFVVRSRSSRCTRAAERRLPACCRPHPATIGGGTLGR